MNLPDEIRNMKSGRPELRQFGLTLGIFFGLLGGLFLWRHRGGFPLFFALSAFFLCFGIFSPGFLKPIQKIWMAAAFLAGWMMSRVILTVLFYTVITPIGLLTRLLGKNFMGGSFEEEKATYWTDRVAQKDKEHYERQY